MNTLHFLQRMTTMVLALLLVSTLGAKTQYGLDIYGEAANGESGRSVSLSTDLTYTTDDGKGRTATSETTIKMADNQACSITATNSGPFNQALTGCSYSAMENEVTYTISGDCIARVRVTIEFAPNRDFGSFTVNIREEPNIPPGTYSLGGFYYKGTNNLTYTAFDAEDNIVASTTDVVIVNNTANLAPTARCKNVTAQLDATGNASITAADVDDESFDDCDISVALALSQDAFTCANIGSNTVTLTVTDSDMATATCTASVTVQDNVAPTALCRNTTVQLDANGSASITASDINSGSSDNCGVQSLMLSQDNFGCAEVGSNTVTLSVNDVNGNSSNCTASVTVQDNVAPTALCRNTTVQLDGSGSASITASDIDNGSGDNCGVQSLMLSQDNFGCAEVSSNTVTLTVNDVNGNTANCSAAVTVQDNIAPVAACLNTTVEIQPDGFYTLQEGDVYDGTNSSDNCAIATVFFPAATFDCDDLGLTFPVTVTVTDPSGNTDNCTANVTVDVGSALPIEWSANDIGSNPLGTDYSFDPCTNNGEFTVTGSGANGTNPFADALAFASQNLCGDFTITTKVESVMPGGYGGIMVRESLAPGAKQLSLFSNLTNTLLMQIRTVTNAPKQQQLHSRPFPTWLRVQRMGPWLLSYYSTNGLNFQYVQAVYMPTNNCLEVGLAAFTNFGGLSTAVFSNVSISGGAALAGSGVPEFVQQGQAEQLPASPKLFPNPARETFTLAFPEALMGQATATLRNQVGQVVAQRQLKPGDVNTEWNVRELPNGLYLMEVRQEGLTPQVIRVIKAD